MWNRTHLTASVFGNIKLRSATPCIFRTHKTKNGYNLCQKNANNPNLVYDQPTSHMQYSGAYVHPVLCKLNSATTFTYTGVNTPTVHMLLLWDQQSTSLTSKWYGNAVGGFHDCVGLVQSIDEIHTSPSENHYVLLPWLQFHYPSVWLSPWHYTVSWENNQGDETNGKLFLCSVQLSKQIQRTVDKDTNIHSKSKLLSLPFIPRSLIRYTSWQVCPA